MQRGPQIEHRTEAVFRFVAPHSLHLGGGCWSAVGAAAPPLPRARFRRTAQGIGSRICSGSSMTADPVPTLVELSAIPTAEALTSAITGEHSASGASETGVEPAAR